MAEYIIKIETDARFSVLIANMLDDALRRIAKNIPKATYFKIEAQDSTPKTKFFMHKNLEE